MFTGVSGMKRALDDGDPLLTPAEVADLFRVGPKTVTRWAGDGRIDSLLTPGGHRRFRESEVRRLLAAGVPGIPRQPRPQDVR